MKFIKLVAPFFCFVFILSCGKNQKKDVVKETLKKESITQKVDNIVNQLDKNISSFNTIATLDHHRMAAEVGVYTPPSIATIFSNAKIDVIIVKENQLAALDLPFKVLCYTEADTTNAKVAYTSSEFIQKRHQ